MNTKHNTRIDEWTFSKAQSFDLGGALGFLFRRLNSLSNAIFAEVSGQQDLTAMQMGILLTVHQAGLITLRDLAERMRVDRSTMQEVVKRMVGRDLLSRRVPPNDRRTHELWLGPIGGQTLARHFHAMGTLQERLLTGIPPEDASVTYKTLKAILERHGY